MSKVSQIRQQNTPPSPPDAPRDPRMAHGRSPVAPYLYAHSITYVTMMRGGHLLIRYWERNCSVQDRPVPGIVYLSRVGRVGATFAEGLTRTAGAAPYPTLFNGSVGCLVPPLGEGAAPPISIYNTVSSTSTAPVDCLAVKAARAGGAHATRRHKPPPVFASIRHTASSSSHADVGRFIT